MLDYYLATSLVRVKLATSPGTFANDPDIADPTVNLPTTLVSADPEADALAWRMPNRRTSKVKLKVTFRKADGTEVAGTYKAYGFVVVPAHPSEVLLGEAGQRPTIENHQELTGTSAEPMVFEDLNPNDVFGLRLYDITAVLATRAFIRAEEVL